MIKVDHFHIAAPRLQLADHLIKSRHAALIPDVGLAHVDGHASRVLVQLEAMAEVDTADKKQLSTDAIDPVVSALSFAVDLDHLGHLAAEQNSG